MKKYIIAITGATATGKSDLALEVARHVNGEIINADIGSLYTPLTIGTAKPNWQNSDIAHHLFDIINEPTGYNVAKFREEVVTCAKKIWDRGRIPVIVGGSAFYIKSLWYRQPDVTYAADVEQEINSSSLSSLALWEQLNIIDAVRAAKIHPHDRYRIVRALAIYKVTGKIPSNFGEAFDPVAPIIGIICSRDRQELYQRINQRVLSMLEDGWIQEVEKLQDTAWKDFLMDKKIIGYDDILQYLQKDLGITKSKLIGDIQQKTRNYAKRQVTFLTKLYLDVKQEQSVSGIDGSIDEINLTLCDVGLYINGLLNQRINSLVNKL